MIAAVLCGGKGTRLRDTIGDHQKCAVDVGGRPWIHRVLDFLAAGGIEHAILLTGYKAEEIEATVEAWKLDFKDDEPLDEWSMSVECVRSKPSFPEAAIQLAFATTKAKALLVVNGDTLVEGFPLADFIAVCEISRRTGNLRGVAVRGPNWMESADYAGRYGTFFNPPAVHDSGIYFRCIGGTKPAAEFPTTFPFLDIGTPHGLAEARRRFA